VLWGDQHGVVYVDNGATPPKLFLEQGFIIIWKVAGEFVNKDMDH